MLDELVGAARRDRAPAARRRRTASASRRSSRRSSGPRLARPAGTRRPESQTRCASAGRRWCGRSGSSRGARASSHEATRAARSLDWTGERAALEPNLARRGRGDGRARAATAPRFERFRALFAKETDPAFRRRYLLALAAFEEPVLAERGIELAFTDEVPLQDIASFVGTLLANRTARGPFWARLRADWERLHGRVTDAPMLLRRMIEAMGAFVKRRELEEAEAFFAAHPVDEARQAIAQTLERLGQDVDLWERIGGSDRARGSRRGRAAA